MVDPSGLFPPFWPHFPPYEAQPNAWKEEVCRVVAPILSQRLAASATQIQTALATWLDQGHMLPLLQDILRIDVEYATPKPGQEKWDRRIRVIHRSSDKAVMETVICQSVHFKEIPWDVRTEGLVPGSHGHSIVRCLYP